MKSRSDKLLQNPQPKSIESILRIWRHGALVGTGTARGALLADSMGLGKTATAVVALLRTCPTFNSIPTVNMKRQMPTWLSKRSVPRDSAGKTKANAPGASRPNSDGPSRMPASISPTTAGKPMRTKIRPSTRQAAITTSN